ncbi:hypothetical protein [Chromobacterium vaccinii]|uniref:hypothetical protein n=1 Tax=Chromobacterium vaccinii TaxID=1108595 RepID=UPI001186B384|nr:hypothetical protein [Chromobacterium vaccinii]
MRNHLSDPGSANGGPAASTGHFSWRGSSTALAELPTILQADGQAFDSRYLPHCLCAKTAEGKKSTCNCPGNTQACQRLSLRQFFQKLCRKTRFFQELCASSALLQAHKNEKALFGKEWGFH